MAPFQVLLFAATSIPTFESARQEAVKTQKTTQQRPQEVKGNSCNGENTASRFYLELACIQNTVHKHAICYTEHILNMNFATKILKPK